MLAMCKGEVVAGVGCGQEHVGPVCAHKGGADRIGLANDKAPWPVKPGTEHGAEACGPRAEDEYGVVGRDAGDARCPIARGEDVADEQGGFIAYRVGDGGESLFGMGHADIFGLSTVDAAAECPAAVGGGAVVHIAVPAEEALAAECLDVDCYALPRTDGPHG